jgi:hypothetical protein
MQLQRRFPPLLVAVALAVLAARADAQTFTPRADDGIAIALGYSWNSPRYWGIITDRRVTMLDVALETQVVAGREWSLVHSFEVPIALVSRQSVQGSWACWPRHPDAPCIRDTSATMSMGVGVLPLSLKLLTGAADGRRMFAHAAGGVSVFSSNMPTIDARRFNFMAEAGIGLELPPVQGRAWSMGYKYVHLSNGDSAPSNPGLDASIVYLRLAWRPATRAADAREARAPASASR